MARIIQGKLDATGCRFAIVISRFNSFIGDRLLNGALDALERHGAAQHRAHRHALEVGETEAGQLSGEVIHRQAGIEQGAQEHVATDA